MKYHVALIVETSSIYGRDLLSGIVRFMRVQDNWSVFLEQRDLDREPPRWLRTWKGDGIISRATTLELNQAIRATNVPLVELTDRHGGEVSPHVRSDDDAIGRLAAEHLIERGFRRFGFCGFSGEAWSERRQRAFTQCVEDEGWPCEVYRTSWCGSDILSFEDERDRMMSWLQNLSPPVGVMVSNDMRGQQLLDACTHVGISVPEEIAVIGVDNDELLCRMCVPPLSSVIPNATAAGYRAAELLAEMMGGGKTHAKSEIIAPLGVMTRQSTDVVAIEDRRVAAALHFIRQNACRGISVDEVVDAVSVSRSTLERQIRKYLRRTPQQEIRMVQIKRARELLATTDFSTERIAEICGFENPEYMYVVFKRIVGQTPGEFRGRSL